MKTFFLETERLAFSIWKPEDVVLAASLWGDPLVARYITAAGSFTKEQIAERLRLEVHNQHLYSVQYWPVYEKISGVLAGCCGLRPYDIENRIYELGFHLKSDCWGKGYATEAARAVMAYGYTVLGATGLFAGHHPDNTASAKVLRKLGFVYAQDVFYPPTGLQHPSYRHSRL